VPATPILNTSRTISSEAPGKEGFRLEMNLDLKDAPLELLVANYVEE